MNMLTWKTISAASVTALVMTSGMAEATSLCASKTGVVTLRTTCRATETVVTAALLGVGGGGSGSGSGFVGTIGDGTGGCTVKQEGREIYFDGCNVNIRSGAGRTDATVNGAGNLVIGYNETLTDNRLRTGSHNLVVGAGHGYSSYGGFVAGSENSIEGPYSSISGGQYNLATSYGAAVSGGALNIAAGTDAWVCGAPSVSVQLRPLISPGTRPE